MKGGVVRFRRQLKRDMANYLFEKKGGLILFTSELLI